MGTTKRFEAAVSKLYNAFHKGELKALECHACAVGNMCDNQNSWDDLPIFASTKHFGHEEEISFGISDYRIAEAYEVIKKTGYSPKELQKVEMLFLTACEFLDGTNEQQFKGLCAVVEYLCELDNIPNIMDYTSLFETENEKPKKKLQTVFN